MSVAVRESARGFGTLLRDLAEQIVLLARSEVALTKLEIGNLARGIGVGAICVALGVVFVMLGGLALLAGLVLLVGDQWLPADRYWLAALIMLVITGAIAAWFAQRGATHLSPSRLAPMDTVSTLKEDSEWLKQRLTSGETSR